MLTPDAARPHLDALTQLPLLLEQTLKCEPQTEEIAKRFYQRSDFLYLGRGINYPIALEGALKLKEISYIHAEGYPAGEMKHVAAGCVFGGELHVVGVAPRAVNRGDGGIETRLARDAQLPLEVQI